MHRFLCFIAGAKAVVVGGVFSLRRTGSKLSSLSFACLISGVVIFRFRSSGLKANVGREWET